MTCGLRACAAAAAALMLGHAPDLPAQVAPAGVPATARASAAIDLTGSWVAIVNEDWRWRMMTPPKGDTTSIQPLNAEGRAEAERWDPATDGSCKAYGAAALLRMPVRLEIDWAGDDVLELHTDAGQQTRRFVFGASAVPPDGSHTLQGVSRAQWQYSHGRQRGRAPGGSFEPERAGQGGSLLVTTSQLAAGWLRRNGVPYSDQTLLTEHFDRFAAPNGDEWLVVTTIVEDPVYLNGPFVTSSHFRREPDDANWSPRPCRADL